MPQAASIVALVAAIAFTAPGYANEDDSVFSEATISDSELSDQRGGFQFAGMEIKLGADIRTYLDNSLVLHTVITIDEHGYSRVQTIAGNLTLADADALKNTILSNGAIRMNVGNNQVYLANEGKTAIIHGNEGALQNILINTASNITASQDVTATLDLAGYDGFAATVTADQLSRSLGDDVARAITGTFGG
jgi:hypothetical protein